MNTPGIIALSVVGGIILIAAILLFAIVPMKTWITALFSRSHISMLKLASLRFRKKKPMEVAELYIMARRAKLDLSFVDIEGYYLEGGNCKEAISALSFAKSANLPVDFEKVKALAFSGQNPVAVLESAVKPKILDISGIKAISQDNIEVIVDARATLKLNINNVIGGLSEDTITSKIQKQIIANIALSANHKSVLASPNDLIMGVLNANQYAGCAYNLVSVEITHVDIGRDIGAEMIAKNAEKEIALAQVEAERHKNDAMIEAEQMKVRTEEMKTAVLEAEAEVPKAIAEAIKEGRFSVMDYYKLMNLQADTAMRRSMMNRDDKGE